MVVISNRQKIVLFILFSLVFVGISIYWYKSTNEQPINVIQGNQSNAQIDQPISNDSNRDEIIESAPLIYVHVKGAVRYPGVYALENGQRVVDAVDAAGGKLSEGNLDLINLATKLIDGQEVIVYTSEEELRQTLNSSVIPNVDSKININIASKEQLQKLSGIGPSKADAIIKYREQHGPFKSVEELVNVNGIGQKTLDNFIGDIVAH